MFTHSNTRTFLYASSIFFFVLPLLPLHGHAEPFSLNPAGLATLDPAEFNLPATAREVVTRRMENAATFELTPGNYASVSPGEPLFTKDEDGQWVHIEQAGKKEGGMFVFDRLAQDIDIRFDLNRPRYTLLQNGRSFSMSFLGDAEGVIENDHTIAYQLADGVILRWIVVGNTVEKKITVTTKNLPDLSFGIEQSPELHLTLENDTFFFHDAEGNTVFSTREPLLTDVEGNPLPTAIHIRERDDGRYIYDFDATGLPSPYIIDPTSGPLSGGTFTSGGGVGVVAWSNPSNAASQNGTYATAAVTGSNRISQLLNATNFSFPIASNDTVNGILAEVYWSDDGGGAWSEHTVMLIKNGSTTGTDKGVGATPTLNTYTSHGGAADLWGTTWAGSDVNASGFGIGVAAEQEFGTPTVRVDHLRLTVYYTLFFDADAPVSGPTAVPFFSWWSLALFAGIGGFILSRFDPEQLFRD